MADGDFAHVSRCATCVSKGLTYPLVLTFVGYTRNAAGWYNRAQFESDCAGFECNSECTSQSDVYRVYLRIRAVAFSLGRFTRRDVIAPVTHNAVAFDASRRCKGSRSGPDASDDDSLMPFGAFHGVAIAIHCLSLGEATALSACGSACRGR